MAESERELIITEEGFPHGASCMDCDRKLEPGDHYSHRLVGMVQDSPIVEVVCVPCGLGLVNEVPPKD